MSERCCAGITYGLTYEEIEKGLPLIDTSRTLIREICPPVFSHVECRPGKYRRMDGLCNNLQHPTWGATMAPFQSMVIVLTPYRLIGPLFSDGINAPRISHTGHDLPLSRVVSRTMHPDEGFHDHAGTVMVIAWGQFMDHDYTLTATPLDPINRNDPEECCKRPPHLKHPYCNEIRIPDDDYFYRLWGVKCIDFVRGFPSPRPGCRLANSFLSKRTRYNIFYPVSYFRNYLSSRNGKRVLYNAVTPFKVRADRYPCAYVTSMSRVTEPDRSGTSRRFLTARGERSRVPYNTLTGALDGNTVYGVTEKFSRKLRTGYGGLLRMNPVFKEYGLKDLLPLKLDIPDEGCTRPNKNMYCFEAGEIRVNEQLVLTVMHTLMAREHNRVAHSLAAVNPHWDDEMLFQEARRINIAEIQHITFNEFLPILLGKDVMQKFGLVLNKEYALTQKSRWAGHLTRYADKRWTLETTPSEGATGKRRSRPRNIWIDDIIATAGKEWEGNQNIEIHGGYWDGYDPTVNPDVIASFAAAAYRFGHSLLPTAVERWSKAHKFIASKRLSDLIRRPYDLYRAGVLDEYVMGLMNQVAQAMDDSITQEVTNHLFKKVGARFGMDLVSFNMQRGREFGIPGYMEFRKFCGLGDAKSFQDLFGAMPNETVRKYETIFEHPIDVDLWSGGVSERPLPGSMLGPTFACIIATQFSYSRRGDRFWFELPNQPSSFTTEQLAEIRKSRLARVICDNTDIIDTVQLYPMVLPDHELNPRVPCRSGIIPSMDFSKWAEPPPFHGNTKEFITEAQISMNITQNNDTVSEIDITNNINCTEPIVEIETAAIGNNASTVHHTTTPGNSYNTHSNTSEPTLVTSDNSTTNKPISIKTLNKNDQVLEYLYKKNDKQNEISKSKGHPKNSLSRKRRATEFTPDPKYPPVHKNAPLIIDYTTNHEREHVEPLTTTPSPFGPNAAKVIKESALADFNIETLHDNQNDGKAPLVTISNETPKQYAKNLENNDNNGSNENTDNNDSGQSNESDQSKENYRSNQSNQSNESNESIEKENYEKRNDYPSKPNDGAHSEYKQDSSEDSREVKTTELPKIQEVDLDDFSYERIQINDKGEIEPTKELNENHDKSISADLTVTTTNNPPTYSAEINEQKANYDTKPVHIDDDKIKPVIERNEESNESSEESGDLKLYNADKPQLENKAFTPPFIDLQQNNYNPVTEKKGKKVNVKDEFERIPLNYNHDKNNATQDDKNDKEVTPKKNGKPTKFEQPEEFTQPPPNEETTEFVLPEHPVVYDDKLHYKFSDVTVKLPEIKLPDDVLAYNYYDDEPKQKQNKKQQKQPKFFYYDHDDDSEENQRNSQYNDEPDYHDSKYNSNDREKDNYRKHPQKEEKEEESDEEEDLYEKFVRERFGKRGTFQRRSEELRALPQDITLRDTIKKVLKKAQETSKEAEKSGDPNAGYMWTLEYQQPL
ncbi:Thyroid peroxidase [Eumeta japonica]|uniref:Thyroid peroxidase n=1 Tax=Eumeta variegata TaxID=151549 RepID=A0A4C1XYR9_EUMVA|nr:Thyroid peroxidase [Eumeta japonica]